MSNKKILIVEDDAVLVLSLKRILISFGYSVAGIASSGENGTGMAEMEDPDLILMDILLKGSLDRVSTAAKIMSRKDLPIIYMTSYTDKDQISRARDTMPYGDLTTPVDKKNLRAIIRRALIWHAWGKKSCDYGGSSNHQIQKVSNPAGLAYPIAP